MATPLTSWERLAAIATLGTRRAPLPKDTLWPEESLVAAANESNSPEALLLRAAVATWLWNVAGFRAAQSAESAQVDVPAPSNALAPEAASWRLARMIGGEQRELLQEWFELARAARKTLPTHWLPVVLDGVAPKLRNAFPDVLGPAAAWLASQHPEWSVAPIVAVPSRDRWQEGTFIERRAELAAMRERDPARGREWLESTWATDPPDARESFLGALQIGVSAADEPFLEAALDDKRKGVRQAAAECLARLPASAHAKRNLARLEGLIVMEEAKSGLLARFRNRKLVVQLPAALDKAAVRDGLEAKPPAQRKVGERAFWLEQMVELVPPRHWCERFGCDAPTFVEAAVATDHASELLSALSLAATRFPDAEFIGALCDAWLKSANELPVIAQAVARLVFALPTERRSEMFEAQLRKLSERDFDAMLHLTMNYDLPWSAGATAFALKALGKRIAGDSQQYSHPRNMLDTWGQRCDVPTASATLPGMLAGADNSAWRNALEQFDDIVQFRAAMRKELT
ncbi:MAG TPA: DUF5691 domain-containing protein [Steroidobacteraceae bacterium]|nr:DUF5691 domain-containing protein [Steroidobacteraceae bacterium]